MISARDAADRLDLTKTRRGWRGACPICSYATGFVLKAKDGYPRGWCASCNDGEAIRAHLQGLDGFQEAEAAKPLIAVPRQSDAERTSRSQGVWAGASKHPALAAYCAFRGLPGLEQSAALRWRADARHPEVEGLHAAMVALVQDVDGRPIAVHRTYTRRDGSAKADLNPAKASKGPVAGGAIRLDNLASELVVAEGIETAAAAGRILGLPAWSAVSAGNLKRTMDLPAEVHSVIIASDPDHTGQDAADGAASRWLSEGRSVRILVPDEPGMDFADLHKRRTAGAL